MRYSVCLHAVLFSGVIVLSSAMAMAADTNSYTGGHFGLEINGSGKGQVQRVEPATPKPQPAVKNMGPQGDIEATTSTIMMESARDAAQDQREILQEMQERNQQKKALREQTNTLNAGKKELRNGLGQNGLGQGGPIQNSRVQSGLGAKPVLACPNPPCGTTKEGPRESLGQPDAPGGELGESQQLRMQNYMDSRQKAQNTTSNILKKSSETSSTITGNIK